MKEWVRRHPVWAMVCGVSSLVAAGMLADGVARGDLGTEVASIAITAVAVALYWAPTIVASLFSLAKATIISAALAV